MRELNGIEATAQSRAELPQTRVLVLSMHTTEDFVRRALKAGASGYLVKDSAPSSSRWRSRRSAAARTYLSSRVSKTLLSGLVDGGRRRASRA